MLMRWIACFFFYMNLGQMFVVLILHLNEILSMKNKLGMTLPLGGGGR